MTVYKFMTQWNQKKINNDDLQKIVSNYNNSINRSINQAPEILHMKTNPENVSNARRKLTTRAEALPLKKREKFPNFENWGQCKSEPRNSRRVVKEQTIQKIQLSSTIFL